MCASYGIEWVNRGATVPEAVPTVPRLFLGEALKRLRVESGSKTDELAAAIGKDRARLSRVMDGKGTLSVKELERLLDLLGAHPKQKQELLVLGAEARKRPTRRPYTDLQPHAYERVADLESMATEIWSYEPGVIPGLLQVPEYIEARMTDGDGIWWESSWEERRNRISFRLERQKLMLESEPAKAMHFIITDAALRTEVGSTDTMRRQLGHLLRIIDERPDVTIQVLSATAAHNPAQSGGMILLHFGEVLRPISFLPVVYGPPTYFNEFTDTGRLSLAFGKLEGLAEGQAKSRTIIAELAKGVSR
jgi:transcriptional regulator with XRE-family HTH domain